MALRYVDMSTDGVSIAQRVRASELEYVTFPGRLRLSGAWCVLPDTLQQTQLVTAARHCQRQHCEPLALTEKTNIAQCIQVSSK